VSFLHIVILKEYCDDCSKKKIRIDKEKIKEKNLFTPFTKSKGMPW